MDHGEIWMEHATTGPHFLMQPKASCDDRRTGRPLIKVVVQSLIKAEDPPYSDGLIVSQMEEWKRLMILMAK